MGGLETPFASLLERYAAAEPLRLHMPGHGGAGIWGRENLDITDLPAIEGVFDWENALQKSQTLAAQAVGARDCLFSAGGSTLALQGAIWACVPFEGEVLCQRQVHKSIAQVLMLLHAKVRWFNPRSSLPEIGKACAVIVTAETYRGKLLPLRELQDYCKRAGIPLIADNAHGAHLAFFQQGSRHPLAASCDLVVDSFHKTLPALTGASVIYAGSDCGKELLTRVKQGVQVFGSTSPNALILASIDRARACLQKQGEAVLEQTLEALTAFRTALGMQNTVQGRDPFRLVLRSLGKGKQLYSELAARNVVAEAYDEDEVICIPPYGSGKEFFDRLLKVLGQISLPLEEPLDLKEDTTPLPAEALPMFEALQGPWEEVPLHEAEGRVCAEFAGPYPPGVPVLMPGERAEKAQLRRLRQTHLRCVK